MQLFMSNACKKSAWGLANRPKRLAFLTHVKLIRRTPTGLENTEINLKKMMDAKAPDVALRALEDIPYLLSSKAKAAIDRGATSVLSILTILALYRI